MGLARGGRVTKTLAFVFAIAALAIIPLVFAFSQSVKQAEPAVVNQPVTWRFTLHASNPSEKSFSFPIPETAFDVTLKTSGGASVQFEMQGGKVVCASCDLSKQDYVIELKTPAPVLLESGWVKNEAASAAAGQEFYSQKETVFNPSEFNYKNVQGFFACGKDLICTVIANKGNPFFKIDSLKSRQAVEFIVLGVKTPAVEVETETRIQAAPLVVPLENYVKQQPQATQATPLPQPAKKTTGSTESPTEPPQAEAVEKAETPVLQAALSIAQAELPEIPELNEAEVAALVNGTPEYSFGIAGVTGNDFPEDGSASAWSVFSAANETTFELNYSIINSSGADPQALFFKTRFYNSANSSKTRVEIAFNAQALCASCFAWLKVKLFDGSLRELGESDVFFNSENAVSNSLNAFLLKPIEGSGGNEGNETGGNLSARKLVVEFDSNNSAFERFYLTAYSPDGEFAGWLEFSQPFISIVFLESARVQATPLVVPLDEYLAEQSNSSA